MDIKFMAAQRSIEVRALSIDTEADWMYIYGRMQAGVALCHIKTAPPRYAEERGQWTLTNSAEPLASGDLGVGSGNPQNAEPTEKFLNHFLRGKDQQPRFQNRRALSLSAP